jgi:hypothetical protein
MKHPKSPGTSRELQKYPESEKPNCHLGRDEVGTLLYALANWAANGRSSANVWVTI